MTNIEPETSILQFEFEEKVDILGRITDSENIKFIRDKETKTTVTVTGFEITIKESDEKKIANAREQTAPRLINILSSLTGVAISYKLPKLREIKNGQTYHKVISTIGFRYLKSIGIDNIDVSKLSSMLDTDSKLNLQLAHAHNGQRAFINNDFPQAIREFYLIFEYTGRQEEQKYRNLRNAVSHVRLDSTIAINDLQTNFGINIQAKQELDVNDPGIKEILYNHTRELRRSVGLYLNGQLRNELAKKQVS